MKDKNKDRVKRLKYTTSELAALSRIASSPDFQILKRTIVRYIRNLKDISFKLPEDNPSYLAKRHAELVGMAMGAKQVILLLQNSNTKLEDLEDELEKMEDS